MDLRSALRQLPELGYSHRDSKQQDAQRAHYELRRSGIDEIPMGLDLRVSGQGVSLPVAPWIALLDPDVTTKVTEGVYLVYLYSTDLQRVYLTLNQGATAHRELHLDAGLGRSQAESAAIDELGHESLGIRTHLERSKQDLPVASVDLGSDLFLPRAYEAGSVIGIEYETSNLPSTSQLLNDLARFARIYPVAVATKDELVKADPQRFRTSSRQRREPRLRIEPFFRPKDSSDYLVQVKASTQYRSRRHELLIEQFGAVVAQAGWTPNTNVHPRDLEITRSAEPTWLVEAKTVGPNAELAVREAIGQLFTYRHFWYRATNLDDPKLLALFSDPVGDAFLDVLAALGIDAVWRDGSTWRSTADASVLITE